MADLPPSPMGRHCPAVPSKSPRPPDLRFPPALAIYIFVVFPIICHQFQEDRDSCCVPHACQGCRLVSRDEPVRAGGTGRQHGAGQGLTPVLRVEHLCCLPCTSLDFCGIVVTKAVSCVRRPCGEEGAPGVQAEARLAHHVCGSRGCGRRDPRRPPAFHAAWSQANPRSPSVTVVLLHSPFKA